MWSSHKTYRPLESKIDVRPIEHQVDDLINEIRIGQKGMKGY